MKYWIFEIKKYIRSYYCDNGTLLPTGFLVALGEEQDIFGKDD